MPALNSKPILFAACSYGPHMKRITVSYHYEEDKKSLFEELFLEKKPAETFKNPNSTVEVYRHVELYFLAYISTDFDHIVKVLNSYFPGGYALLDAESLEGFTVENARAALEKLHKEPLEA